MSLPLTPMSVDALNVFVNPCDLHRDLHRFLDYVRGREVKRATRSNKLPKTDYKRLAKLLSDPHALDEINDEGYSEWVDYVDQTALKLGFVSYDTKGVYAGYHSSAPSYPDNYIEFNRDAYQQFCDLSLWEQEAKLRQVISSAYETSEFFHSGPFGRSTPFNSWGSATGLLPTLDFAKARRFLLDLLGQCESGIWYSTQSLVAHLKQKHPYFLIPQKPNYPKRRSYYGKPKKPQRYDDFHESKSYWGHEITISEHDPDGFERVEGRYVERFLEYIPLTLRYVDLAYAKKFTGLYPSRDYVRAFRVNDRFLRVMKDELIKPRITVQPNFEVHLESDVYPVRLMSQLNALGKVIADDVMIVLKLEKKQVAEAVAADDSLDVLALLKELSDRPLPQNVVIELTEWAGASEKFILYDGFGLLESPPLKSVAPSLTEETISSKLRIVRQPEQLYQALEQNQLMPLRIRHRNDRLIPLPKKARTIFPKETPRPAKRRKKKPTVIVNREIIITLRFSSDEIRSVFRKALANARVPVEAPPRGSSLSYKQKHQAQVDAVLKKLRSTYTIKFLDT